MGLGSAEDCLHCAPASLHACCIRAAGSKSESDSHKVKLLMPVADILAHLSAVLVLPFSHSSCLAGRLLSKAAWSALEVLHSV